MVKLILPSTTIVKLVLPFIYIFVGNHLLKKHCLQNCIFFANIIKVSNPIKPHFYSHLLHQKRERERERAGGGGGGERI
jgi:hypothetical protein